MILAADDADFFDDADLSVWKLRMRYLIRYEEPFLMCTITLARGSWSLPMRLPCE